VILGLASFMHVFSDEARAQLLASMRKIAPRAPVLVSFVIHERIQGRMDRLRPPLRRLFRLLGAPGVSGLGDVFWRTTGFSHVLGREELERAVRSGGYRMEWLRGHPIGHAMLVPVAPTTGPL
jgi:hypothetical protein